MQVAFRTSAVSHPPLSVEAARPTTLPALTGLRFLAAMLVVCCHFGKISITSADGPLHVIQVVIGPILSAGYIGVNFFFLLSGFILAYTYLTRTGEMCSSRRSFWIARFARIYPIYLVAFALSAGPLVWRWHPSNMPALAIMALTLTQAWFPRESVLWNPPAWTLSCEAFFYLLFPFIAPPLARVAVRRTLVLLVLLWLAMLVPTIVYVLAKPDGSGLWGQATTDIWQNALYYNPLGRLPEFAIGILLGCYFIHSRNADPAWQTRNAGALACLMFAALTATLAFSSAISPHFLHGGVLDPLLAVLIYAAAWCRGPVAALFATPVLVLLGEASYSLYILHVSEWRWMNHLLGLPVWLNTVPEASYFLAYFGLVIASSVLAFRLLERPARRIIRLALR